MHARVMCSVENARNRAHCGRAFIAGVGESGIECRSSVQGGEFRRRCACRVYSANTVIRSTQKGRLSLPAALRKGLTEDTQLVVVPNVKTGFLSVYTVEAFEAWQDALFEKKGGYNPGDRMHVMLRTKLNASAMPQDRRRGSYNPCRETARDGVSGKRRGSCGQHRPFGIWDAVRWDEFQSSIDLDELLFS